MSARRTLKLLASYVTVQSQRGSHRSRIIVYTGQRLSGQLDRPLLWVIAHGCLESTVWLVTGGGHHALYLCTLCQYIPYTLHRNWGLEHSAGVKFTKSSSRGSAWRRSIAVFINL